MAENTFNNNIIIVDDGSERVPIRNKQGDAIGGY
jgi:hypothetical protein